MVIASITTTAATRPKHAGFECASPFLPSVVAADGVKPHVWPLAGRVVPMPVQDRTVRYAVNQESPPREVVLR